MSRAEPLTTEADVELYIDTLVVRSGHREQSFEDMVRACHGAFPTAVLAAVERIAQRSPGAVAGVARAPRRAPLNALLSATSLLPLPHPLDFEWRFSDEGCSALSALAELALHPEDRLALLGTPGFAEEYHRHYQYRRATLFERRLDACEALLDIPLLKVVGGDLQDTSIQNSSRFQAAVADPPWYREVSEVFLRCASDLLIPGGTLFFCVPGLATRPKVLAERRTLTDTALRCGLVLEGVRPSFVEYEAPPFEVSALAAAGLPDFDTRWRRGDLMQFRRVHGRSDPTTASRIRSTATRSSWQEVVYGRARIRVDTGMTGDSTLPLQSVVPGDVLDTVSSRDPRRAGVNVWTTTNRVFTTCNPGLLLAALRVVAGEGSVRVAKEYVAAASELIDLEIRLLRSMGIE